MSEAAAGHDIGMSERALLGEQTAGSLIRNVWAVYRRHFVRIAVIFVIPTFPLLVLTLSVSSNFVIAFDLVVYIAWGALAIAISDICLGTRPSVRRSYSQVLRRRVWVKLFTTALLTAVLVYLGLLLLIVGVFWVYTRLAFAATVVALERRNARAAVRRSWALTRGQFWRLFGLLVVTLVTFIVVAAPFIIAGAVVGRAENSALVGTILVYLGFNAVLAPAVGIAVVLLYYDERVRSESYDADALSEDLMR